MSAWNEVKKTDQTRARVYPCYDKLREEKTGESRLGAAVQTGHREKTCTDGYLA